MKLKTVAVTGADEAVSVDDLNQIGRDFPFVEWALLYMPERMGEPRFPSADWIDEFRTHYNGAHKAMHLCGSAFTGFVNDDPGVLETIKGFTRIQLNLEFGDVDGQYDPSQLMAQIGRYPGFEFIIQYTEKHKGLLPALKELPNHAILFDRSAGRGVSPESWPAPIPGHVCGYAGGLSPDNIDSQLKKIAHAAGDTTTWIDMESGVRTYDRFDLEKVRQILSAAKPWIA